MHARPDYDPRRGQHRQRPGALGRPGFTLIEVLIVLVIILAIAGLIAVNAFGGKERADQSIADIELKSLRGAMDQFRLDFNRYPTDEEGVAVLWSKSTLSADADQAKWRQYLTEPKPTDPWGSPWGYRAQGERMAGKYDLWSYGPDREEGTEDDIQLWKVADDGSGGAGDLPPPPPPPPSGG